MSLFPVDRGAILHRAAKASCPPIGMERWQGRTAVVTGASSGIGAAVAVALADAGLNVVGIARRKHLVDALNEQVTGKGSIVGHACDLYKPEDITATFRWVDEHYGGTDLLHNNAAVFYKGQLTDCGVSPISEQQITSAIDLNFKAAVLCTRHAVRSMNNSGFNGLIVFTNSTVGHSIPFGDIYGIQAATKYAITAFSSSLANELTLAGSKIKVTSISPSLVATGMTRPETLKKPILRTSDICAALLYIMGTPPYVNINELTMVPVLAKRY